MINALIKAASVNVEPFWPGLFAKALANVNIKTLICNIGLVALPRRRSCLDGGQNGSKKRRL
ncbi:hypothetical protein E2I00_012598 [Balaenoptera physalus]|uniref:Large ribosomal subunit protein P2 n=1 Tax=Balaenoptera physalus TaxID=9770 RepID=A0A643ATX1_BALPH|nr:hypothetical protein E2I00_012598 [Balaenoptera physalus]